MEPEEPEEPETLVLIIPTGDRPGRVRVATQEEMSEWLPEIHIVNQMTAAECFELQSRLFREGNRLLWHKVNAIRSFLRQKEHEETVSFSGWSKPEKQEHTYWCYAAVEVALWKLIKGVDKSQEQIAHDFYLRMAPYADTVGQEHHIQSYAALAEVLILNDEEVTLDNMKYHHQDDMDLLKKSFGEINIGAFEHSSGALTEAKIADCIDSGGLVVLGSDIHYEVIYGYRRRGRAFFALVWDPKVDDDSLLVEFDKLPNAKLIYYVIRG